MLEALLDSPAKHFIAEVLDNIELLALFGILFFYHWKTMQRDGDYQSAKADEKGNTLNVLCMTENDDPLALQLASLMEKEYPKVNIIVQSTPETEADIHALILPEKDTFTSDEKLRTWIEKFNGSKFIVPSETSAWFWADEPEVLAKALKDIAEGESPKLEKKAPAWMIAVYILAGLMAFQLLFILIIIIFENFGL